MPVHVYTNWNKRNSDSQTQIEPYRKYFFICEGANTETYYFEKLIDLRKQLGIHSQIDIRLLEKTEEDKDLSHPKRLIQFADQQKQLQELDYDRERDRMIVVFDADIFEFRENDYDDIVKEGEKHNILAVSNPAFELFLLLHIENSWNDIIKPNLGNFFLPKNLGGKRSLCYRLFRDATHMNPKKNKDIGMLAEHVDIAIRQEKNINEDIHQCKGQLTCNVGSIIEMIREDKGEL
ncbi:MAG: RloB family protein [Bilifractor sp.]|jgi:hypothetical protein